MFYNKQSFTKPHAGINTVRPGSPSLDSSFAEVPPEFLAREPCSMFMPSAFCTVAVTNL